MMKKRHVLIVLLFLIGLVYAQEEEQASLISIDLVANSSGPMTPRFVFKGTVNNAIYVQDSVVFTGKVNGSSLSSVSPDDGGQFFVSVALNPVVSYMFRNLNRLLTIRAAMYEIRFGADDAGLAFELTEGKIIKVPFTVWDINCTPNDATDDEQMLVRIYNAFGPRDFYWGIRDALVSSWTQNPAHESDWIYFHYYQAGTGPELMQQKFDTQEASGIIDMPFYENMTTMLLNENEILARITINSLDQNPLSTINSLTGLARPRAGTVIRWNFYVPLGLIDQKLYTSAGENFVFKPKSKGTTKPTITTVQLPAGMNFNGASEELSWVADTTQSGYHDIILQADNEQGTVQSTYRIWVDRYGWEFKDHNNNNVVCSVFNNGNIGKGRLSSYYTNLIGNGFSFFGLNVLTSAIGSLTIAVSDTQISGLISQNRIVHSYATETAVKSVSSLIPYFSQSFHSEYTDKRADYPIGVRILQSSYSRSTVPDNNYMIMDYDILNTNSTAISGMYVGLNLDLNVGFVEGNLAGYDDSRQLSYIYEANGSTNTNYYGQALLNATVSGHHVDHDSIGFRAMQSIVSVPADTTDYRSFLSSGPYSIPPGKSIRLAYVLAAGLNLADLQSTIDAARAVNLNRKPVLANPINNRNLVMGTDFEYNLTNAPSVFNDLDGDQLSFAAQSTNTSVAQASIAGTILTVHPVGEGNATITVEADDGNGGTESTYFIVSVSSLPAVNTTAATNITPVSAQFNSTVSPAGQECQVFYEYGITTSYGDTAWADQNPVSGTLDVTPTAAVFTLEPNTEYHFRVAAISGLGKSIGSDLSFYTAVYPANVTINRTYNFPVRSNPGDYVSQDYRLIGLPGRADQSISNFISGDQEQDWEVYWDNGANSNYMVNFDGGGAFTLIPGKAFWIIHKGDWSLDYVFLTAPLNSNEEVEINLHNGWNQISNPFPQKMAWTSIQSLNGISDPIWSYQGTGGFQQAGEFTPFEGYYYFNSNAASVLRIPYRELFINPLPKSAPSWQGQICLESEGTTDAACWFGVSTFADRDLDNLDFRKPRTLGNLPAVYFPRSEWDNEYSIFARDVRPPIEKAENWSLEVFNPEIQKNVLLTVDGVQAIPAELEVYLLDKELIKYQNIRTNPCYEFKCVKNISRFELFVGEKESVLSAIDKFVPVKFALGQNFPNPFNPSTIIPVSIPAAAQVKVVIYNTLGQEIITLFNGNLEVGRYYLVWDGTGNNHRKMPSGIYLYRLTTEKGLNLTGKMVLIK
jgi:hypothetical protein